MEAFDKAFKLVIGHEGKYSRDTFDRGNWTGGAVGKGVLKGTKYGISAKSYPFEDIENLTLEQAKAIYLRDYWTKLKCGMLPRLLAYAVFDAGVNAGVVPAAQFLQMALRIHVDGRIGPQTLKVVQNTQDLKAVLAEMLAQRNEHNRKAPSADAHGLGWSRRLFKLAIQSLEF